MSASSSGAITNSFVQILLGHAANTPPKIDPATGNRILSHSKGYMSVGVACFCMALMMFLISLAASPWDDLVETIVFSILMAFFIIAGILVLLVTNISKVIVLNEGITVRTPWYLRSITWEEMFEISYSWLSESLVITSNNKTKVRISPGYNGITYLVQRFDDRVQPSIFSDSAKAVIDKVKAKVKNK